MSREHKTHRIKLFRVRIDDDRRKAEDEALLNDFIESVEVKEITPALINTGTASFWTVFIQYREVPNKKVSSREMIYDEHEALTPEEQDVFDRLRHWRYEESRKEKVPPFMIFHDAHLKSFVKTRCKSIDELNNVKGVAKRKIELYGSQILAILTEYLSGE